MSDDETVWENILCQALEPANDYARRMRDRYRVSDRNDRYGIDHTLNIISQAFLAGVEYQASQNTPRP